MWGMRRRSRKSATTNQKPESRPIITVQELPAVSADNIIQKDSFPEDSFAVHMAGYRGQTVTVFVNGGGPSGAGFTGVLLVVNRSYIKLITRIGPPPACSLGNLCLRRGIANVRYYPYNYKTGYNHKLVYNVGSMTYIPVNKITSFVHNSL